MSDITDNPETPRSAGRRGGSARRGAMDPVTSSPGRDLPAFEDESHLLDGDDVPGKGSCADREKNLFLIVIFIKFSVFVCPWKSDRNIQPGI